MSNIEGIPPEQVPGYIMKLIKEYDLQVDEVVKSCTKKIAKKVKPTLKGYSKKGGHLYKTGVYKKGWGLKTISRKNQFQIMTYNRAKPTLVHLLEFGHGGIIHAKAYPHVRETELKYLGELMNELEKGVYR